MRLTPLASLVLLLATHAALAQAVANRIVVTAEDAKLQTQNGVVGSVRRGKILTVKDVKGEWSWVNSSSGKETVQGWIHRRDAIPFEKSLEFFTDSLQRKPSAELYAIRGTILTEKQEYDKAIADFDESLRLDPQYADALSGRDRARLKRGGFDKALATPGTAARLDPKNAVGYYKRGLMRQKSGDFDKALADFNQALRFDPKHASTYAARGALWQNKGEIEKAIADYDAAIRLDPMQSGAHANRGLAWHQLGRYDKAIEDWKETLLLDAKHVNAHCALAWLLATCPDDKYRDGKRAVELATNACEMSGWKYANGIVALAAAYAETGDFENAVKWQEEFLRLGSEADQKKWGFLLDLYKSRKLFRGGRQGGGRQEIRFGFVGRYSPAFAA